MHLPESLLSLPRLLGFLRTVDGNMQTKATLEDNLAASKKTVEHATDYTTQIVKKLMLRGISLMVQWIKSLPRQGIGV